ncbi:hypothetical protein KP509_39G038500 [Ceratopteris richardii]|uniref:ubiquitinyl hydrolase 1 n=1 Tax=Ceratopteris richardii TaxID=49495 RepID=A0A8T2Q0H3_CERRI|nr:hypothetical protein KP509_39G038500 [Ceratopteris richardii]KAH7277195.1 hypothetical protein KP509_39G038500 [Ceratopteris richardii]
MLADDHILVRWGLHNLLEGYSGFSTTDIGTTNVETNDHAHTVFFQPGESYTLSSFDSTEDDEVIAHALQEELRQECVGKTQDCSSWARPISDIRSNGAVAQHDSYYQKSNCDCNSGDDGDDERFLGCLDDSSDYDGEIGKRITHIDFTPHIPKTNGEIPTDEDACAAHARLIERLMDYTLSELKVEGDGNCQFRAFSDQLYRSPAHHKAVRDNVVMQLCSHPEYYEGYVPMKYSDYVKKMSKSGEWGDHVTLQAAADYYGMRICLLTSFRDTSFIQILPKEEKSRRVIYLSFWSEVHYNSIYAEGDVPVYSDHKKGKHWSQKFKDILKF